MNIITPKCCLKKQGLLTIYFKNTEPSGSASFIPPEGGTARLMPCIFGKRNTCRI